jgi:hypothetical protein
MLKTLDVLIGVTTVLLLFSMAVTVITQAVTSLAGRRNHPAYPPVSFRR